LSGHEEEFTTETQLKSLKPWLCGSVVNISCSHSTENGNRKKSGRHFGKKRRATNAVALLF
jgi:hypothetical protein